MFVNFCHNDALSPIFSQVSGSPSPSAFPLLKVPNVSGVASRKRCCLDSHLEDAFTSWSLARTRLACQPCVNRLCCWLVVQPLLISLRIVSFGGWQAFYQATFTVYPFTVWYLCGVSFLAFTAITVDRFLAHKLHLRYHVAVTHTRAALVVALIWKVNGWISSMRLWNRNTVAVTTLLCLLGSFVAYWRIFGIVRSYNSKTSDTDSLPRVGACAWKTAPDDVTVENVDLEYVLCLLYFLFLPHSACFLHGCLVRLGKMVVSHCWWPYLDGGFSQFYYQPFIVLLASTWNAVKNVFTQLHCKLQDCNSWRILS